MENITVNNKVLYKYITIIEIILFITDLFVNSKKFYGLKTKKCSTYHFTISFIYVQITTIILFKNTLNLRHLSVNCPFEVIIFQVRI